MSDNARSMDSYYLKYEITGAVVTVALNQAPIVKSLELDSTSGVEPINSWLMEGVNTLSLTINSPDVDEVYRPSVKASVYVQDKACEFPEPETVLAEIEFSGEEGAEYPLTKKIVLNNLSMAKTCLWNEAEKISAIDDNDKLEIVDLVNALSNSIIEKDFDKALELQEYKIKDNAVAEYQNIGPIKNAVLKNYRWLSGQSGLVSKSISPDDIELKICCDDSLIYVQRQDGDEAVLLESDDVFFDTPIFVARIKGSWKIVR